MSETVTVLLIGDVVGESALAALEALLPLVKQETGAALAVVNGENAADGFGMTEASAKRIFAAGADVITSGNHIWEKREFLPVMDADPRILRPANYPDGTAGRGAFLVEKPGARFLVINLQGRENMSALVDCPFRAFDRMIGNEATPPFVIVDFNAESTREKEAFAFYVDGRAAAVAGTHTHIQTADERVLPGGTAYISDLGMTGVEDSVIGMNKTICLNRMRTQILYKMECAKGPAYMQGVTVTLDCESGTARAIERWTRRL